MSAAELVVEYLPPVSLRVDENNARLHSAEQVAQVAASIVAFGPTNPILIDEERRIIAGHGRQRAALDLGLPTFPTITLRGLTLEQKRAYAIADNRLAENATWDFDKLAFELDSLRDAGVDGRLLGFSPDDLAAMIGTARSAPKPDPDYTTKIETPIYTPKEPVAPIIGTLVDKQRTEELLAEISASGLDADIRAFLSLAASRHLRFDYHRIAEFYAHAAPATQRLFERSALVIIDYEQAIELGYAAALAGLAELSGEAAEQAAADPETDDDQ